MRRNDELTYNHSVKYGSLEVIQDALHEECRVSRPSEVLIRSTGKMRTTSDEASVEPGNVDAEFLFVRMGGAVRQSSKGERTEVESSRRAQVVPNMLRFKSLLWFLSNVLSVIDIMNNDKPAVSFS